MDASMKKELHLAAAALMIAPLGATTANSLHMANANASSRNHVNAEAIAPHYSAKFNQKWRAFNRMNAKKYGHMSKRAYALRLYNEHLITDGIVEGTQGTRSVLFEPYLDSHLTMAQKAGIRAGLPVKGLSNEERTLLRKYGITNQHLAYLNFKNLNAKRTGAVRIPKAAHLSAKTAAEIKNNEPVRGVNARQQNVLVEFGIPVANGQRVLKTLGIYNEEAVSAPSYNQLLKQTAKAKAQYRQNLKNVPKVNNKTHKLSKAQRLDLAIDLYINKVHREMNQANHSNASSSHVAHAASTIGGRKFLSDVDYAYGHRHGWKRDRSVKRYNAALAGIKQATHSTGKWVLDAPTEHQAEQRGTHLVVKAQTSSSITDGIDKEFKPIDIQQLENPPKSLIYNTTYSYAPKKSHKKRARKSNSHTMRISTFTGKKRKGKRSKKAQINSYVSSLNAEYSKPNKHHYNSATISSYVQSLNAKFPAPSSQNTSAAPANNAANNQQIQDVATDVNDADKILIDTTQNGSMGEGYVDPNTYAQMLSQRDALAKNGFTFNTDIENGRINGGGNVSFWDSPNTTTGSSSLAVTTDKYGVTRDKQTDRVIGDNGSLSSFPVLDGASLASLASASPSTVISQGPTTLNSDQFDPNQGATDDAFNDLNSDDNAAMSAIGSDTTNSMDSIATGSQAPASAISAESSVASSANSSTDDVWNDLNSEDNNDASAIGSDSTDMTQPKSISAPSSIAHTSSAVSSAASNIASQASSASNVVDHDNQNLNSDISKETKAVVDDAMRDAVNNTTLPSDEKSMAVNYFRDHGSAINNPNAVSSDTNSDVKSALADYYKVSQIKVPKSAAPEVNIDMHFNSVASSAAKNNESSVASSASSKAASASSVASSAISNYNANETLGSAAPTIKGSAKTKPSDPNESQLNVEQLQALHDNNVALANAENSIQKNKQSNQKISDVKTLHGRALRVPHVANGKFGLFTKPEVANGAKQVVSGKDLKTISNKDDSFAKTFMVFQTAKSSDGSTYYHVISYNAKYIGWINAAGMKRITLGKAKAEPKGQYTIQNRMLDSASGEKTSANHNEAPITDDGQVLNPAFVSAYSSIAQQLLDGNANLAKAADVSKGDVDGNLTNMYTFASTEKGNASAKDKKAAKALQDYVQYKLNIPHYEASSNQQARN